MRMSKKTHRNCILAAVMIVVALTLALPNAALAIAPMQEGRSTSLTIQLSAAGQAVPGAWFDLYRVADASEYAEFTLTGDFAAYPVVLEGATTEDWRKLSATLAGYAAADTLTPLKTAATDEEGTIFWDGLNPGLYLTVGRPYAADGKTYTPEAALVSLPGRDENDQWIYDVTIQPKQTENESGLTSLEVLKVWKDGDSGERPAEITVLLLCNGRVAEQVALNRDNNWRYEWTGLDGAKLWQVIERPVPEDYTLDIDYEGTLVTITNTREDSGEPGTPDGNLPQTGLNWQPVWAMAAAGMLLFLVGWIRHRQSREQ